METRLDGKVALVSGGAGGIGGATARLMAAAGARVILADRSFADDAAEGERHELDVTREEDWARVVAAVVERWGGLHVLVNAAGIEGDQQNNSIVSTTLADWRRVHAVNLDGTFLGCRAVIPAMERQGHGSIVNIASVATAFPMPFNCAYGSSKAAVAHLTRSVAAWGSRHGHRIRCNSVHPGLTRTRMLLNIIGQKMAQPGDEEAAAEAQARATIPLRTLASPEDIARQVVYLASDDASQVTGAEFRIDGGWSLVSSGWERRP